MSTLVAEAAPPTLNRWWRIAGGLLMNLALGSLYAWSVFVAPLEADFGWKRTDTSTAFTIAIVTFALGFVLAGRLQDRFGPVWISVTGGLLASLGFWMCADTRSLAWLYAWFGVVVGLGNGFGYATPIPVMAKWFPDRRGLAVGFAVAGYGGGSALIGPLCSGWLIPTYGWPATFRILGAAFLLMTLTAALLLRNPPPGWSPPGWTPPPHAAAAAAGMPPSRVVRTRAFWLMWLAYALGTSSGLMVISQLKPFATGKGVGEAAAAAALVVGAVGSVAGRLVSGAMSDRLGRLNVLRLMIAVSIAATLLLDPLGASVLGLYAAVFAVYWGFGAQLSVNASAAADFWGTPHAGANYGLLFTAYGVAGILGPRVGAMLFDRYQNYQAAFSAAAAMGAAALACELLVRRPNPAP